MQVYAYNNGIAICLYVTANARKELLFLRSDGNLAIKVGAPALDNRANLRIIELMSSYLGIAKSNISIRKGEHAKRKEILIKNYSHTEILSLLKAALQKP